MQHQARANLTSLSKTLFNGHHPEFEIIGIDGLPTFDENEGVLLFEGGTVCGDGFTDVAADAVCRHMGHHKVISWRQGLLYR